MQIILVRHGETDWNVQQKYQGQTDIGLNQRGREEAERLALSLKNEKIEAIYSSDLSRTCETAQIIARSLELHVNSDARLRELSFGAWEGKTFGEVYRDYQPEFQQWFEDTLDYQLPGGESFNQLLDRFRQSILDIFLKHHNNTVVIVSHGGVIRSLLYQIKAISQEELWGKGLPPGSYIRMSFNGSEVKIIDNGSSRNILDCT
jgi:alpha-ribazole phosphatase/probable phosphoglycerate mutase